MSAPLKSLPTNHRPPGPVPFAKLRALSCYDEAHRLITEGVSAVQVAKFIHGRGEYLEAKEASLASVLKKYRASLPPLALVARRPIPAVREALHRLQEGVDEVEELGDLYRHQRERIEIDSQIERRLGKLLPTVGPEVRTAKDILRARAKIRVDLGELPQKSDREAGVLDIEDLRTRYGDSVATVAANPESRRKVLQTMNTLLLLGKREGLRPAEALKAD